jgi:rfaE bifunctional protein kinase chain/domain/rfaE bifunctional protein nucleotidyltransferase chain/domain
MEKKKVMPLDELVNTIDELKSSGKKIVQCHGCFDVMHIGHIKHFQAAKKEGDVLVVTLTPDRFIKKGPGRPYFNEKLRAEQIAALECVDYVAVNNWETAVETLKLIRPDIYVKGKEVLQNAEVDAAKTGEGRKSYLSLEEEVVKSFGGRLHLTDEATFSSSRIINEITENISEKTKEYLREFKTKWKTSDVENVISSMKDLKVLVIGDAILDEYVFCQSMEKSGKEALVAYKFLSSEIHAGGAFAIANHIAEFSDNVGILTSMGSNHQNHVENKLNKKISKKILRMDNLETLVKRRYINQYKNIKIFEVYNVQNLEISGEVEEKIIDYLNNEGREYDMIVASDFGHGLMTPKIIENLVKTDKFLAVNTQLNAGNLGYNFITKYPRADFVSLNDRELRLPLQGREDNIKESMTTLAEKLKLQGLNVTLGKEGNIYYSNGGFYSAPALTAYALDTIGAGDAVLAIGSMCAYKKANPELIPFIVNSVGALAVKIMGNRAPVSPGELNKFVSYIMR